MATDRWLVWMASQNTLFGNGVVGGGGLSHAVGEEGYKNTAFGYQALHALTIGYRNDAFGVSTLEACTTGDHNLAFGHLALQSLTTGAQNVALGGCALSKITTGVINTAIGYDAMWEATGAASYNTAVGTYALSKTSAQSNAAFGQDSLASCTTGGSNTGLGKAALSLLTTGIENVGVGTYALTAVLTGDGNTAVGYHAGGAAVVGSKNILLGYKAGFYETGSDKLFIDNRTRASEVDAREKALIYGVFADTVPDQSLRFNAGKLGFYGAAPVDKPTGVPTTAAGIHAALVTLGLIAA